VAHVRGQGALRTVEPIRCLGPGCCAGPTARCCDRSAGSGIAEFLYGAMAGIAQSFLQTGKFDTHNLKAFTYGEINALLKPSGKA